VYYLILPFGNNFGWGICGQQLVKELSRLAPVRYLTNPTSPTNGSGPPPRITT
jgi:hypothetical protein